MNNSSLLRLAFAFVLTTTAAVNLTACGSSIGDPADVDGGHTPPPPADAGTQPADAGPQAVVCGPGIANCGGTCRDLTTDRNNCGACGQVCGVSQTCINSICTTPVTPPPTCGSGMTSCTGTCCNLQTDAANCGGCGMRCAAGATCTAGRCVTPTPTPACDTSRDTYDIVPSSRLQAFCPEGIQVVVMGGARGQDVIVTSDGRVDTGDSSIDRYFGASGQALSLSTRAGLWSNYMIGVTGYCASTRSWLESSVVNAYRGFTTAATAGFRIVVRGHDIAATNCPIPAAPMVGAATPYPWCTVPSWMACR